MRALHSQLPNLQNTTLYCPPLLPVTRLCNNVWMLRCFSIELKLSPAITHKSVRWLIQFEIYIFAFGFLLAWSFFHVGFIIRVNMAAGIDFARVRDSFVSQMLSYKKATICSFIVKTVSLWVGYICLFIYAEKVEKHIEGRKFSKCIAELYLQQKSRSIEKISTRSSPSAAIHTTNSKYIFHT